MRYNHRWLLECTLLRIKAPKAYRHLKDQDLLPVPCISTIQKLLGAFSVQFGICQFAMDALERFVQGKTFNETLAFIGHDEMAVAADVQFNSRTHEYDGLLNKDFMTGTPTEGKIIADHVMNFKIRFLLLDFEITVCTIPSKSALKGTAIYSAYLLILAQLELIGVHLIGCVSDGAQPNVAFWNQCGIVGWTSKGKVFNNKMIHPFRKGPTEPNYEDHPEMFIYFVRCTAHLEKCKRNNILNHGCVRVNCHFVSLLKRVCRPNYYYLRFQVVTKEKATTANWKFVVRLHSAQTSGKLGK